MQNGYLGLPRSCDQIQRSCQIISKKAAHDMNGEKMNTAMKDED